MIVFCTVGSYSEGRKISKTVVDEGLCACVNLVSNVTSFYKWEGKFCEDEEMLMIIKTRKSHFNALKDRIKSLHSYDTPEIIAVKIEDGDEAYLAWLSGALKPH